MTRTLVLLGVVGAVGWIVACGSTPPASPSGDHSDAGVDAGIDAGIDAGDGDGGSSAGPWDLPSITYKVDAGDPISAPNETWTFVPVPDAHCGNGTSTGIGVNLTDRSNQVLIFLAGGGACWEAAACAAGTAVHIQDTMGEAAVLGEAQAANMKVVFDRTDPNNPFRDASFVYVPYCTGDLHAGTQTTVYDWFGPRTIFHTGARNIDAYLRRLQPTFPEADRVWLAGISAGGYGATLNAWRVQKTFPWARVDVLNDSGLMVDVAADGRYGTMQQRWAPEFPPNCSDCQSHLSAALDASAALLTAPRRYGMLGYLQDNTIALFFGLQGSQIESQLGSIRENAAPNVKTFYVQGNQHVVLATPAAATSDGGTALEWVRAFAADDPSWDHAGP